MKLYLSSTGLGNKRDELEKWREKHGEKLIIIPNAMDDDMYNRTELSTIQEYLNMVMEYDTKIVSLKDYFGKPDDLKKDFKNCHAFFSVGGNVFALRKAMQLSGFDKFLKEISKKDDYLYGGYSAGIAVLAPSLKGLDLVDEPINPYNNDEILYDGVGILDYVPIPHYNPNSLGLDGIDFAVQYCKKNGIKYKTLKDGDVIVDDTNKELER